METEIQILKCELLKMKDRIELLELEVQMLKRSQHNVGSLADRRAQSLHLYRVEYERQNGNMNCCNDSGEDEID